MPVRATASLMALINQQQSHFGCGAESSCLSCYPVQTVCGECDYVFRLPILRTDLQTLYICESCWDFSMNWYGTRVKAENPL